MKLLLELLFVAVAVIPTAFSQLFCHRCFGNSYCNDVNHADFETNIRNTSCIVGGPNDADSSNPLLNQIEFAINQNFLKESYNDQAASLNFSTQGHCVTATVYEPHDTHTLRICVTRNVPTGSHATLCELLQDTIAPMNRYNGSFSCRQCNGTHFCNNHTLNVADGVDPITAAPSTTLAPSPTTLAPATTTQGGSSMIGASVVGVLVMMMFAFLY